MADIQILSNYLIGKKQFSSAEDLRFNVEPISVNYWKVSNPVITHGYLIKVAPEKYYLVFDVILDNYNYDSFKVNYGFFFTNDYCTTFDTYVQDTDTGTEYKDFMYYDCQKQLDVCTWKAYGNVCPKNVDFVAEGDNISLVLVSNKDSSGYDVSVTVGHAIILDKSEIIGNLP